MLSDAFKLNSEGKKSQSKTTAQKESDCKADGKHLFLILTFSMGLLLFYKILKLQKIHLLTRNKRYNIYIILILYLFNRPIESGIEICRTHVMLECQLSPTVFG